MAATSIDKALEVLEALSRAARGASVGELARTLGLPAPTVHRLLAVLRRRGYVRQDEETQRYGLTLKMLDLSFRFLGRSEIRLHAYPVLREYVLRSGLRAFVAIPGADEVTYVWATGPDEVGMRTVYGKEMPAHCAVYFSPTQATRRLHCLRLDTAAHVTQGADAAGAPGAARRRRRGAAARVHVRARDGPHGTGSGAARRVRARSRRGAAGDRSESRLLGAGASGFAASGLPARDVRRHSRVTRRRAAEEERWLT